MSDHDILSNHDIFVPTWAMKIHEIFITADGVVNSKNLPTDVYYDNVKITESWRYRRVEKVE